MPYLVTISDEDQPSSGFIPNLEAALEWARGVSERVMDHPRWDGADVRVWEASDNPPIGPTLDRLVARFVDGEQIPSNR